jgi:hypothetical protein
VVTAKGGGRIDRTKHRNTWTTSAAGASVSFPIALSAEGPIYAWPRIRDDNPATYTYSLDGAVAGTATTQTTPSINTQNGSKESLGFLRFPSVAPGKHVVTFTQTSAGSDGVSIVGIGTPADAVSVNSPSVLLGAIPYQFGNGRCNAVSDEPCLEDTLIVEADRLSSRGMVLEFGYLIRVSTWLPTPRTCTTHTTRTLRAAAVHEVPCQLINCNPTVRVGRERKYRAVSKRGPMACGTRGRVGYHTPFF